MLGAKFDDASLALGEALLATVTPVAVEPVSPASTEVTGDAPTEGSASVAGDVPSQPMEVEGESKVAEAAAAAPMEVEPEAPTLGLSAEQLEGSKAIEMEMRARDAEIRTLLAAKNSMESYVLDMRGAPKRKHGE